MLAIINPVPWKGYTKLGYPKTLKITFQDWKLCVVLPALHPQFSKRQIAEENDFIRFVKMASEESIWVCMCLSVLGEN